MTEVETSIDMKPIVNVEVIGEVIPDTEQVIEGMESNTKEMVVVEENLSQPEFDPSEDVTLRELLNAKRSPRQDTTSKRILRKSTIRLAGISKEGLTDSNDGNTSTDSKDPENPIATPDEKLKKKKSIKNLFGLLSFKSSKSKTEASSLKTTSNDAIDGNSTDETSNSASFSTENGLNPIATDHINNPIKSLQGSPAKTESLTSAASLNGDEVQMTGSPSQNNRRASLSRIRSKSIHRVVSVRLREPSPDEEQHAENKDTPIQETEMNIATTTTPVQVAASPAVPTPSSASQLFESIIEEPLPSSESIELNENETTVVEEKGHDNVVETTTQSIEPMETTSVVSPTIGKAVCLPPPPPARPVASSSPSGSVIQTNINSADPITPVLIQTPEGRRMSVKSVTPGAPIPPPPPPTPASRSTPVMIHETEEEVTIQQESTNEQVDHNEEEKTESSILKTMDTPVVIRTPDGRRLSVKALTPGAPVPPPPPALPRA